MKIQVFGTTPPCARCKLTEKLVKRAVEELGYEDIEVVKVDVYSEEAERYGKVMSLLAFAKYVNEELDISEEMKSGCTCGLHRGMRCRKAILLDRTQWGHPSLRIHANKGWERAERWFLECMAFI